MRLSGVQKDVARLVKEAKSGKAKKVYLFAGEAFDTRAAAQALIDELVPESKRAFNLEVYDGRTTPIAKIRCPRLSWFTAGLGARLARAIVRSCSFWSTTAM